MIIPWLCAFGAGILRVMALWNLRRLGSTVTIGDTATPRPSNLAVRSGSIGCAYKSDIMVQRQGSMVGGIRASWSARERSIRVVGAKGFENGLRCRVEPIHTQRERTNCEIATECINESMKQGSNSTQRTEHGHFTRHFSCISYLVGVLKYRAELSPNKFSMTTTRGPTNGNA